MNYKVIISRETNSLIIKSTFEQTSPQKRIYKSYSIAFGFCEYANNILNTNFDIIDDETQIKLN